MPWKVEFEREAEKELNRIDQQHAKRILKYLFERIASPDDPRRFGEALKQNLSGLWKYRVGNYRIVYNLYKESILVLRIGHRKNIYKEKLY